jgi:hypothetical protein
MALSIPFSHISLQGFPFPVFVFVFSCLVYLFGRRLLNFVGAFVPTDGEKVAHRGSGLNQAEKGSLKRPVDMSEDEVFQLEKRAFFSKVGSGRSRCRVQLS